MNRFMMFAVSMAFVGPVLAADGACGASDDAVDCFLTSSKSSFQSCSTTVDGGLLVSESRMRSGKGADDLSGRLACVTEAKSSMKPLFDKARVKVAKKKAAEAAVKDYYVYWIASMDGLAPLNGESWQDWKVRQSPKLSGIQERQARISVER